MSNEKKFKMSILGPGGGKTTYLIKKILEEIPKLNNNKIMAVITYTNMATNQIKYKLSEKIEIPENLFIGTIHSFLNRFILKPYGYLCKEIPLNYTLIENFDFSEFNSVRNPQDKIIRINAIRKKLTDKGLIGYDYVESKASKIISEHKNTIRQKLSNRIQYLFVDEIQDATNIQYKILEELRKAKKTEIYCIGDPEQYIYGFTYRNKSQSAPKFNKIPINKLKADNKIEEEELNNFNYRSSKKIIDFLNNFSEFEQEYSEKSKEGKEILFINKINLNESIPIFLTKYRLINESEKTEKSNKDIFFLSKENKTFNDVISSFNLESISNSNIDVSNLLNSTIEYIISLGGTTKEEMYIKYNLNLFEIRKIGIALIRKIINNEINSEEEVITYLKIKIHDYTKGEKIIVERQFTDLINSIKYKSNKNQIYSSIHKAKGLEASGVLVVAKTKKELEKWLELDRTKRSADKMDICRLGFVAFSRAMDFLAIACLENIDDNLKEKLNNLNVEIIN